MIRIAPFLRSIRFGSLSCIVMCCVLLSASAAHAAASGLLYALSESNSVNNSIYGYSVNELTGELTALSGFPKLTDGIGNATVSSSRMVVDAVNGRLYALNYTSNTLSAYSIDRASGALTPMPFSPLAVGAGPISVVVHPSGSPLLVASVSTVQSFLITDTTATQAAGSPFAIPGSVAFTSTISPDGNYFYTGGNTGNSFAGFSVNAATGVLTPLAGSPFATGSLSPEAFAVDLAGRLYVTNSTSGSVNVYTTSGGVPTAATGSPFAISGLMSALNGVIHPNGYYMVTDHTAGTIGVYQISGIGAATTMAAASGSPATTGGTETGALALNQDGSFLFAANGTSRNLTTFHVNPKNGILSTAVTQPANTLGATGLVSSIAYVRAPSPSLLYVLQDSVLGNQIQAFNVNENSGQLSPAAGFPIATGGTGDSNFAILKRLAIDTVNGRLYALNAGSLNVTVFAINPFKGTLTLLPFSPINLGAGSWNCLALSPSGTVLTAEDGNGFVASFAIGATTVTPAPGNNFSTGAAKPYLAAFSVDGNYLYTGGNSGNFVAGFSVNSVTGVLTPLAGSPYDLGFFGPLAYVTDPSGRLFAGSLSSGIVQVLNTPGGIPTAAPGNTFVSGLNASVFGLLHPSGYLMLTDRSFDQVAVLKISGSGASTSLAAVAGSPFDAGGSYTESMALNSAGNILFAANHNSRNIASFTVNSSTGALLGPILQPRDSCGGFGGIAGIAYQAQPAPLAFASGAVATPNPAVVGQSVSFSAAATGGFGMLSYSWNFGDGSPAAVGASVTHAYTAAGMFTATVRVTDIAGVSSTASIQVAVSSIPVNGAVVGTGPDSDGDGFSDAFETVAGTDPGNAASTPTGAPATTASVQKLSLSKPGIKLNFAKPNTDSISFSGVVIVPEGFNPTGAKVIFDVGGVTKIFTLSNGAAKSGGDAVKFSIKTAGGSAMLQTAKFTAKFQKSAFATTLAADGFTNATASKKPVMLVFTLIFNNTVLQKSQLMNYSATQGKSGMAK